MNNLNFEYLRAAVLVPVLRLMNNFNYEYYLEYLRAAVLMPVLRLMNNLNFEYYFDYLRAAVLRINWNSQNVKWVLGGLVVLLTAITLGLMVFGQRSRYGAVVSNGLGCAEIGSSMLYDGGSSVDAAIATLLCEGVMLPQSMGIGGGFVATVYTKRTGKVETLIARESAPLAAKENMYLNKEITGAISAGVPGEILGYWSLHRKYGILPWKRLFQPTINLCKNGHTVSVYLHNTLKTFEQRFIKEPSMAEIFVNPQTGNVWEEGDNMTRPQLGKTLELIAEKGVSVMYNGGEIGKKFAEDVQSLGGIITEKDLMTYEVAWDPPVVAKISSEYTLYTTPLPSSGAVLAFILNLISGYGHKNTYLYWHYVIESFKHAYGQRTKLGDMHFEPEIEEVFKNITNPSFANEIRKNMFSDKTFQDFKHYGAVFSNSKDWGSANMAVLDLKGNAITVTSTINSYFGGKVRSSQTGIILNDEMDDFSTPGKNNFYGIPPSPANYIKPRKRPMSSTCPSIVLDNCGNVKMLVGAAGGSKITTSVSQTIIKYLILDQSIESSVQDKRLHHQLAPMEVQHENDVDDGILNYLNQVGHVIAASSTGSFSALTAIGAKDKEPIPVYDERRVGSVAVVSP